MVLHFEINGKTISADVSENNGFNSPMISLMSHYTLSTEEEQQAKEKAIELFEAEDREVFCPMCRESCGKGMGSGRIYMLHHTIGCKLAKLV